MVSALSKKRFRDFRKMFGQISTIALVVACGISGYITLSSAWASLELSKQTYYRQNRFADVFANLKRAPDTLKKKIERIPGVSSVDLRVVESVRIPIAESSMIVRGKIISLNTSKGTGLNRPYLRQGRFPIEGHAEILLLEAFAKAHELKLGDQLSAVLNGTLRQFKIVGLGGSPEYIFALGKGEIAPDAKKFAVMWAPEDVVESAFQMIGAFNDVSLKLEAFSSTPLVLDQLDNILEPYGGARAISREKQISNYFLSQELQQLEGMATFIPIIFLAIAAFLLNTVLSRLIQMERGQIAILKALGYDNTQIASHYFQFVLMIVLIGTVSGIVLGTLLGHSMTKVYADFFKFSYLRYELEIQTIAISFLVSFLSAGIGVFKSIKEAISLPPAEAMRPPTPALYNHGWIEKLGLQKLSGVSSVMILREIIKKPWRFILSTTAIAMAIAIMIAGRFSFDALDYLLNTYLPAAQREDVQVDFSHSISEKHFRHIESLPGVLRAEATRFVPVEFKSGHQKRTSTLITMSEKQILRRLIDAEQNVVHVPSHGVVLTDYLARILDKKPGDFIETKIFENDFPEYTLQVSGTVKELFGMQGYITAETLHHMLKEPPRMSSVLLTIDSNQFDKLKSRLTQMPEVLNVVKRDDTYKKFREQSGAMVAIFTVILAIFASAIVAGVVYNNARISLSVRSRDLASLRVLGFTKVEISSILLGELALQIILSFLPGIAMGVAMSESIASSIDPENYRLPVMLSETTIFFSMGVTVIAGAVSALLVRRKLDQLDLISVLKIRE